MPASSGPAFTLTCVPALLLLSDDGAADDDAADDGAAETDGCGCDTAGVAAAGAGSEPRLTVADGLRTEVTPGETLTAT